MDNIKKTAIQLVKFSGVGVINTVVSYCIYSGIIWVFSVNYVVANIISFFFSVTVSFFLNSSYVFKAQERTFKIYFKTVMAYAFTGLVLSNLFLLLWIKILHINQFVAPLVTVTITTPLNFIIQKMGVYKAIK